MLPQFIAVAQFTILKTLVIVVPQGMVIDIPVVGELISKTVIPSVTITKKDEFGTIIEGNHFGIVIGPGKSLLRRHRSIFYKYPKILSRFWK